MAYIPQPIDTSSVTLSAELLELTERLAENTHDHWAAQRLAKGWTLGPRDDDKKQNPCLRPYGELPEAEKDLDRTTAMETLKAIVKLGYRIERVGAESPGMS
jgi:ryanodine receptor 2